MSYLRLAVLVLYLDINNTLSNNIAEQSHA